MNAIKAPIVVAGVTDSGARWAQLWDLESKTFGGVSPECFVTMSTAVGMQQFGIRDGCPDEWVPIALAAYSAFRAGTSPEPTHELSWHLGKPRFTPISADPVTDEADSALDFGDWEDAS